MSNQLPLVAIMAATELLKFYMESRKLHGKSVEEVMQAWADSREDVRDAVANWRETEAPNPR